MNAYQLIALYDRVAEAPDAIARLRRFVLDLAVRGKLVAQDAADDPAPELVQRIAAEIQAPLGLPSSWRCVPLGRVLDFKYGRGLKAGERLDEGPVPVFGSNGIVGYATAPLTENPAIIVGRKGSAGALNLCDGPSWTTDVAYYVEAPHFLELQYLFLTLQTLDLDTLGKGVKPGLSRADAYPLLLEVPPLAEQRRIVAKVEKLMALLDRLEAAHTAREATRDRLTAASFARLSELDADNGTFQTHVRFALDALPALTTRPDQIKPLRQTILNLAIRGKLVEQDPADEPASINQSVSDTELPFEALRGWRWVTFSDVATFENGDRSNKYPKRAEYVPMGVPWINTGHIQSDGSLCQRTMNFVTEAKFESLGSGKIRPGDLLYCLRGATFGKTAIVEPFEKGAIASSLMIIRPGKQIDRKYTYLYLRSPLGHEQLRRFDNGTAQPNLSSASVKQYLFPLPPLAEQHRIVAKVDALMALCDRLEAALATRDTTRARLLEALLHETLDPAAQALEAAE